jgi:endonuclease YncB( thermonuclease family)
MFAMRGKTATTALAQFARTLATLLVLGLSVALSPARAQAAADDEITGYPTVVDGDTLDFGGRAVRLFGIDAPELDQTCRAAGRGGSRG